MKRVLSPLLSERVYGRIQALSMARDIRSGAFTEPEIDLVHLAVRDGEAALDLGANFGMWTYPLSRAVGTSGRVWAFEPIPYTASVLRSVISLLRLRNVDLVEKGCAEKAGSVDFAMPVQESGAISAGQAHAAARDDDRAGKETHARLAEGPTVTCEVVAIDDVVPPTARVALLKADIEGAEPLALQGARATIDRDSPTIVCEINPWFLEGFGFTLDDLVGGLFDRGYEIYRYLASPSRLEPVGIDQVVEDNYVFIHPSRRDRFASLLPR